MNLAILIFDGWMNQFFDFDFFVCHLNLCLTSFSMARKSDWRQRDDMTTNE